MSPEQASGKPADERADIWSFGVVLWEMLTDRQLFASETVSHTPADVLRAPIDLGALPKNTPPAVRGLIARCLDRDVKKRLRGIGEARILLENPHAAEPPITPRRASRLPWIAAAVLFASTAALAFYHFREAPPEALLISTNIPAPDGAEFHFAPSISISLAVRSRSLPTGAAWFSAPKAPMENSGSGCGGWILPRRSRFPAPNTEFTLPKRGWATASPTRPASCRLSIGSPLPAFGPAR